MIVFGKRHIRHLLRSYLGYYNEARTHLSLDKDAPVSRDVEAAGRIFSRRPGWIASSVWTDFMRQAQATRPHALEAFDHLFDDRRVEGLGNFITERLTQSLDEVLELRRDEEPTFFDCVSIDECRRVCATGATGEVFRLSIRTLMKPRNLNNCSICRRVAPVNDLAFKAMPQYRLGVCNGSHVIEYVLVCHEGGVERFIGAALASATIFPPGVSLLSGGSGMLDTRLDTPPSFSRRYPDSRIALV